MPLHVLCKNCGQVLYSNCEFKSLAEILKSYGYICPNCGRRLIEKYDDLEIKKARTKPL